MLPRARAPKEELAVPAPARSTSRHDSCHLGSEAPLPILRCEQNTRITRPGINAGQEERPACMQEASQPSTSSTVCVGEAQDAPRNCYPFGDPCRKPCAAIRKEPLYSRIPSTHLLETLYNTPYRRVRAHRAPGYLAFFKK